jgi:hypothetical protein
MVSKHRTDRPVKFHTHSTLFRRSQDSITDTVNKVWAGQLKINTPFLASAGGFFLSKMSTSTFEPTHPPSQWVPGALLTGKVAQAKSWPPYSTEVEWVEPYVHYPTSLHDVHKQSFTFLILPCSRNWTNHIIKHSHICVNTRQHHRSQPPPQKHLYTIHWFCAKL